MKNADMPAMPATVREYDSDGNTVEKIGGGLTKRERFAMAAMQGILSDLTASEGAGYPVTREDIARQSVEMADALLAELERTS